MFYHRLVMERSNKPKHKILVECDSSVYMNQETNSTRYEPKDNLLKARSDGLHKIQYDGEFSKWPRFMPALNLGLPNCILHSKLHRRFERAFS